MTDDVTLYDRDPHYIPRVAAVHDMCGYGKCSLTAAIPILSAAGPVLRTHQVRRVHVP
jgi:pyridoxine kinase